MPNNLQKRYQPSQHDAWQWNYASSADLQAMLELAKQHFEHEMSGIVKTSDETYVYALDLAITHQRHNLAHEQLLVCRHKHSGQLLAYSWIGRGHKTPYSQTEMAEARMAHLDLDLSPVQRVHLMVQILSYWETWALACAIPVIISTTIRQHTDTFLRLHERMGYTIRGGIGYKSITGANHEPV